MNYCKPEVKLTASALREIQGMHKPPEADIDQGDQTTYTTVSAYAADE
jgi:hypothetical protein